MGISTPGEDGLYNETGPCYLESWVGLSYCRQYSGWLSSLSGKHWKDLRCDIKTHAGLRELQEGTFYNILLLIYTKGTFWYRPCQTIANCEPSLAWISTTTRVHFYMLSADVNCPQNGVNMQCLYDICWCEMPKELSQHAVSICYRLMWIALTLEPICSFFICYLLMWIGPPMGSICSFFPQHKTHMGVHTRHVATIILAPERHALFINNLTCYIL